MAHLLTLVQNGKHLIRGLTQVWTLGTIHPFSIGEIFVDQVVRALVSQVAVTYGSLEP
jgi:hypothetical protein